MLAISPVSSYVGAVWRGVVSLLLVLAVAPGCDDPPEDERDRVAAAADLTTRQLIAALNAENKPALAPLLVITSTTGGPPRALTADELGRVMVPQPPFEYVGAGKPGTMVLADQAKQKRIVRLVTVGDRLRVLASSEPLAAYLRRETGESPVDTGVRVVSVFAAE